MPPGGRQGRPDRHSRPPASRDAASPKKRGCRRRAQAAGGTGKPTAAHRITWWPAGIRLSAGARRPYARALLPSHTAASGGRGYQACRCRGPPAGSAGGTAPPAPVCRGPLPEDGSATPAVPRHPAKSARARQRRPLLPARRCGRQGRAHAVGPPRGRRRAPSVCRAKALACCPDKIPGRNHAHASSAAAACWPCPPLLPVFGLPLAAPAQPRNPAWPRALTMGTAAPGGTYAIYGARLWADGAGRHRGADQLPHHPGPQPEHHPDRAAEIELGMVTMGVALQAWNGEGAWTQGTRFRSIRALFPDVRHAFPRHCAAPVGHHAAGGSERPHRGCGAARRHARHLLAADVRGAGHSPLGDPLRLQLRPHRPEWSTGCWMHSLFASGVPVPSYSEVEAQHQVNWLDFTEEEVRRLTQRFPELSLGTIPRGVYRTTRARSARGGHVQLRHRPPEPAGGLRL